MDKSLGVGGVLQGIGEEKIPEEAFKRDKRFES